MHGRNVLDVAVATGREVVGFLDDAATEGETVNGLPVLGPLAAAEGLYVEHDLIVAIGDCSVRLKTSRRLEELGGQLASVIHPSAVISPSSSFGRGVFASTFCRLSANSRLGNYALVEGWSLIGTDVEVGEGAFIGPGTRLIGGSSVGVGAFIGAGSVVLGSCRVGEFSVVAAGSVVTSDVSDRSMVAGQPAEVKKLLD